MQNSRFLVVGLSGVAVALALSAAEEWTSKDYTQWSDQAVQKVLNNSPWAQKVSVSSDKPNGGGRGGRGGYGGGGAGGGGGMGGGGGGMGGGGGAGGGGGMGGGGLNGGSVGRPRNAGADETTSGPSATKTEVVVRWESALPVKQARLRAKFGDHLPQAGDPAYTLDKADQDYVISLTGLPGGGSGGSADSHDALLSSTRLLVKGKDAIAPEDVTFGNGTEGYAIQFLFPRSTPIDLDDKEVTFQTSVAHQKIERKFKLKDMILDGKLAL